MVPLRSLDILIITALREEYDQVLLVDAGAFEGSTWQIRPGPLGYDMAFRAFRAQNGQPLQVAVTWATNMGGVAAASLAEQVLSAYRPRCIAMSGVCAGRRGATNIGDVIIADRVWMYDAGKLKAEYDAEGKRTERVQGDVITYNLRADWKKAAEGFSTAFPELMRDLSKNRPRPMETQADWVLARLLAGESPRKHPEVTTKAPNFPQVMDLLWKMGLVRDGDVELTDLGKKRINRLLVTYDDVTESA
ncbi:MAG TPA: hypothetical protein PK156_44895, partial [Polyangium sp.]|nr:hypothetical protein [Polyangium sp.]